MHRIPAPRWVITGRVISTTESSWAWARGPVGVTTTVGAGIALSLPGAEDITVALAGITEMPAPITPARITANLTPLQRITASLTLPRITANPTPLLTPPRRVVGKLTAEAGKLMVVENTASL
jgi:hypothetical protein